MWRRCSIPASATIPATPWPSARCPAASAACSRSASKAAGEAALAVAGRLQLFARATSLGGVESLVEHRATIEGPDSPVPPDLLRLSVGIEEVGDLIADLDQALARR